MNKDLEYLFSTKAIRERCRVLHNVIRDGRSDYFSWHEDRIPSAVEHIVGVIKTNYPTLEIPYHGRWRHINVGDTNRVKRVEDELKQCDKNEIAKRLFEMTMVSVLVDAGAGMQWKYHEKDSEKVYSKSEGLAVAAFDMFAKGYFSSTSDDNLRVDAEGLRNLTVSDLETVFQVSETNPIVGLPGRCELLNALGQMLLTKGQDRLGHLYDLMEAKSVDRKIDAEEMLKVVLFEMGCIWPGRLEIDGTNLGDVWRHNALGAESPAPGYIPFHKLSQWLTYSLLECFEYAGYKITGLDKLTGLPEYRNGGLLLDFEILGLKDSSMGSTTSRAQDTLIIEWRAATVCFLDDIADEIRSRLDKSKEDLPLAKILEGGTWAAGRVIAKEKRIDGGPPLNIESDGTVF